jgi:hypothetical protein
MPRGKPIDADWLRAHYPMMTTIDTLLDDYEREFGWRPSRQGVYVKASHLGIHKAPVKGRGDKCERAIRWSKEPEMERWMLEHDHGQRMDALQAEWRERWGFGITRTQVSLFRASHGTQVRRSHGGGKERRPVGYERESKDGYIVIKFKERPDAPLSKDNWKLKHVWLWEQEHGPLPEDHSVYFADGDNRNFEPSNLVAVPNRLVGQMNLLKSEGVTWHDAESLTTAIAMAEIRIARNEAMARQERVCKCCGKRYTNWQRYLDGGSVKSTICPECGRKGRKPPRFDYSEIRRLRARGMTYREISERVGCTLDFACRVCKRTGDKQ